MAGHLSWRHGRKMPGMSARGRIVGVILAFTMSIVGIVAISPPSPAQALSGSEFDPGYIISDAFFYDGNAMSAAEIQTFLDGQIGTCLTDRCLNVAVLPVASRPASYSTDTGGLICSAIAGGTLRVSELIYRTQVACGISAKVILVTLQKEQGLVTSRAPSDWALRAAMGMGCPDTAPCDDAFTGLASQIMLGTRQLNVYKIARFARQPGQHFIQYHPNASCGGTWVNVRNYATAALYNYTPYQPNSAALANLGGIGDSCSSYGNRNFWRFYNQWFGSTIEVPCTVNPIRDISRYWEGQGSASGPLGAPVSPGIVPGPAGTTIGYFVNGDVYCTPRVGTVAILGDIRTKFEALGGAASTIGPPVSSSVALTAGGVSGTYQVFQQGMMLSSSTVGTFAVLDGPMRDAWGSRGGTGGSLGWPIGDLESVSGGVLQQYQHGLIMIPTGKPAIVMTGEIGDYWAAGSNATLLGPPNGSPIAWSASGVSGTLQYFDKGLVMSSTTTGTFAVVDGAVRNVWGAHGGSGGPLGWPVGDQEPSASGYRQVFQHGTVYASSSGAGGTMSGEIATYWSQGANSSRLGYPVTSSSVWAAGGVTGFLQYFERGMVLSSATTGTFSVLNGPMREAWGARGGSGGSVGWPTGDQETVAGELRQQFQRGVLTISTGVAGDIGAYWSTGANASKLGPAVAPVSAYSAGGVTGMLQYFERGIVMSSTATGTFAVLNGQFRNTWGSHGGSGGSLGWPVGDQESVPGGARQQFQHGFVLVPSGGSGVVLSGEIGTYWSSGSNASILGSPISSPTPWTAGGVTGILQYFERGLVMSSSSTGTYAVLNGSIRDAWGSAGGSAGSLGWPISNQESTSGGVRQQFQRGAVFVPTGGTGLVLAGEIGQYWSTGSNSTLLGAPTTVPSSFSAGGVAGQIQYFQRGLVMSSTVTGTYGVLNGAIRNTWSSMGGSGGILGWPTTDQISVTGGIQQSFQRGMVTISPEGTPTTLSGLYYAYWTEGSNSTLLGSPVASPVAWSAGGVTGSYQVFDQALVMSSTATGTYAVLHGPIRDTWGSAGGSGGSLGWPTADQQLTPDGILQQFQHGQVIVPTAGAPYIIPG